MNDDTAWPEDQPQLEALYPLLGHNTLRGAAGATVLNAELLYAKGMLEEREVLETGRQGNRG